MGSSSVLRCDIRGYYEFAIDISYHSTALSLIVYVM